MFTIILTELIAFKIFSPHLNLKDSTVEVCILLGFSPNGKPENLSSPVPKHILQTNFPDGIKTKAAFRRHL